MMPTPANPSITNSGMLTTRISLLRSGSLASTDQPPRGRAGPANPGIPYPVGTAPRLLNPKAAEPRGHRDPRHHSVRLGAAGLHGLELLDRHEHGPGLGAFGGSDHSLALEQVHQPPGSREADPQLALQH